MATASDYVKLHLVVFIWGFTAILGALITIPSVELVLYRTLLSAIGIGLLIAFTKKGFNVSIPDVIKLVLTGFIVAAHWITFFGSARISNISVCLVGLSTASLWTSMLEPLAYGRRIKLFEVLLGCVVIAGLYIVFTFSLHYRTGLLVGVLSGFTSALFSVINSKIVRRVSPYSITFYEMMGAFIGTLLFLPFYVKTWATDGTLNLSATAMDWLYIFILATVCTVYTYSVATELMRRLSVFFIQLTINLEPLYGFVLALLIFGEKEKMHANFYFGAAIILTAVLSYPFVKKRFDKKPGHSDNVPLQEV